MAGGFGRLDETHRAEIASDMAEGRQVAGAQFGQAHARGLHADIDGGHHAAAPQPRHRDRAEARPSS